MTLARWRPLDDHRAQLGVLAGAACQRRVAPRQILQVIQVGARQAEQLAFFGIQQLTPPQLPSALGAYGFLAHHEHDQILVGFVGHIRLG
jgi:hypothetical protein